MLWTSPVVIIIGRTVFSARVNRLNRKFIEFFFSFTGQNFAHRYSNFTRAENTVRPIIITIVSEK